MPVAAIHEVKGFKGIRDDMLLEQIEELDKSLFGIVFADKNCRPKTFFVGAAIENAMAREIYEQLNNNTLSNGANLTSEDQVVSLCDWLINI